MSTYSKIILGICFLFTLIVPVQSQNKNKDLSKYLEGAVPEVEGKVIFTETIQTDHPVAEMRQLIQQWAKDKEDEEENSRFKSRIIYDDTIKNDLVLQVDDRLIFSSNALSLDFAMVSYSLFFKLENQKCIVTIKNIKYKYSDEKGLTAENMISDDVALNKQKNKLNRTYNKFRIATVNMVDNVFDGLEQYFNREKYDAIKDSSKSRRTNNTTIVAPVTEAPPAVITPVVVEPKTDTPVAITQPTTVSATNTSVDTTSKNEILLTSEAIVNKLSKEKDFSESNFFLIGEDVAYVKQLSSIVLEMLDNKASITCYSNNDGIILSQVMPSSKFKILYYKPKSGSYSKLVELSKKYAQGSAYTDYDITLIQVLLENSIDAIKCNHLKIEKKSNDSVEMKGQLID